MSKLLLFIITIITLIIHINCKQIENDIINNIKELAVQSGIKNCPILNFEGYTCPINISYKKNNNINIIGGLGFSTLKQTTKLPILKSANYSKIKNEEFDYYEYDKASVLFDTLYSYDNNLARAGIYSKKEGADQLFVNFYSNSMKGTLSQKRITFYEVNSISSLDESFEKVISILPQEYNEDAYNLVVEFWGDSYLKNMKYGGIFEDIRALRSCYNADIKDVEKNVESIIYNNEPSKEVRYLEYASYSQVSIYGGNPEILENNKRLETIETNPVFVLGIKKPIWDLINDDKKRENMKMHIENTVRTKITKYIQDSKERIKQLFLEEAMKEKLVSYAQSYPVYDYSYVPWDYAWLFSLDMYGYRPDVKCNTPCRYDLDRKTVRGSISAYVAYISDFNKGLLDKYPLYSLADMELGNSPMNVERIIDENGYYYEIGRKYNKDGQLIKYKETEKTRSGCVTAISNFAQDVTIIPNVGWKYGIDIITCYRSNPRIDYIQEWGQNQEYLRYGCPKTI